VTVAFPSVSIGPIPLRRLPLDRTFLYDNGVPPQYGSALGIEEKGPGTFLSLRGKTGWLGEAPFGLLHQHAPGFIGKLEYVTVSGPARTVGTEKCTTGIDAGWEAAKHPRF
jgi:hypothetical protein